MCLEPVARATQLLQRAPRERFHLYADFDRR